MKIDKRLMRKQGVYMLHIKHHLYIGSSVNIYKRIQVHANLLLTQEHYNEYLQMAYDKYGKESLSYEILEISNGLSMAELRERELFYIRKYNADLNLKKDSVSERNCPTTSRKVYQYDYDGTFIKSWPSVSEAARYYKVHNSNITVCCLRPKRQQICKGFLWSYDFPYPYPIASCIYVFDLDGIFIGKYKDTVLIAENLFKDTARKTVLSQLKKKIDSDKPYKGYYLSTNRKFIVTDEMKKLYKSKACLTQMLDHILKSNPLIYIYNRHNEFMGTEYLNNLPNHIANRIKSGRSYKYSLTKRDPMDYQSPTRRYRCFAQDRFTGEVYIYDTKRAAALDLFNDLRFAAHICKHIKRNTSFRGYQFRDL